MVITVWAESIQLVRYWFWVKSSLGNRVCAFLQGPEELFSFPLLLWFPFFGVGGGSGIERTATFVTNGAIGKVAALGYGDSNLRLSSSALGSV